MRIENIASGSTGNCTYIGTDNTHVLIDTGISKKRILEGLKDADLCLDDIDAILITHEHIDHICSLGVVLRAKEIPVYSTKGTIDEIKKCSSLKKFNHDLLVEINKDKPFKINDLSFTALKTSHDAKESVCYKFQEGNKCGAIVTDLGVYDDYLIGNLKDLDFLMLEANHDIKMLEVGPYPYPLKQRILSDMGHLSNEASGQFLDKILNDNIKGIMLGHLSKENNTQDLARWSVENEINSSNSKYKADDFEIRIAHQSMPSEIIEF